MPAVLTRPEIISELRQILQRVTDNRVQADQVREQDEVFGNLGLSSLELLELRFEVESTWNIELEDSDVMDLLVVSDVIELIEARTAGQSRQ
jgi:acyl carrier protein